MDTSKPDPYLVGSHNDSKFFDEMSESIIPSSDDNTIQLSLPDSFDETFTVNGIPLTEELLMSSKSNNKNINLRLDDASPPSDFSKWIDEEKQRILSLGTDTYDIDYDRLKYVPKDRMTLVETVALVIHNRLTSETNGQRKEVCRLREQIESLEYELEEARRSKKTMTQRFESLRSELTVSDGRQHELNNKVRELQEKILEFKESERKHGSLKQKSKATEEEIRSFQSQVERHEKTFRESASAEKATMQKLVESERKLQSITTEKAFLEKEADLLLERVERTEKDYRQCEASLSETNRKYEATVYKAKEREDQSKAEYETKVANEISRAREDCNKEVSQLFKHRIEAWERENSLLRESRNEVQKELERLRRELNEARETYEKQLTQHSKASSGNERELLEVR